MKGLHKDFGEVVTKIQLEPARTWVETVTAVKGFAKFKQLNHLCESSDASREESARTFFTDVKQQCKQWTTTGTCDWSAKHEGTPCKFNHGDRKGADGSGRGRGGGPGRSGGRGPGKGGKSRGDTPSGVLCPYCGKGKHKEADCYKKKAEQRVEKELQDKRRAKATSMHAHLKHLQELEESREDDASFIASFMHYFSGDTLDEQGSTESDSQPSKPPLGHKDDSSMPNAEYGQSVKGSSKHDSLLRSKSHSKAKNRGTKSKRDSPQQSAEYGIFPKASSPSDSSQEETVQQENGCTPLLDSSIDSPFHGKQDPLRLIMAAITDKEGDSTSRIIQGCP
jgi:hypothetical protein